TVALMMPFPRSTETLVTLFAGLKSAVRLIGAFAIPVGSNRSPVQLNLSGSAACVPCTIPITNHAATGSVTILNIACAPVVYFFFFGPRAGLANCESRGPIAGDFHGFSDHVWKPDPSHKMTHKRAGGGPCRFNQHVA